MQHLWNEKGNVYQTLLKGFWFHCWIQSYIQTFCSIRTCLIVFYMPIRFSTWLISKYCLKINKWKKYKARVFSNKVKTKQRYLLRLNLDLLARSDPINCFTVNNYNVKNLILQYGWESFRLQSSSLWFIRK